MAFDGDGPAPASARVVLADRVAVIRAQVDALAAIAPRALDCPGAVELFDAVFELADRLQAVAVRVLPVIESDGGWALGGARTFPAWLARRAHLTHARATRLTRLGRALRDELRLTADAVVAGGPDRVGMEQAQILTTTAASSDQRRAVLTDPAQPCGEAFLLTQARMLSADQLRTLARRWAAAADPDADERGYRDATDREFLDLAPTTGGTHLSGFLTTEHGHALLVALDALDAVTGVPAADDTRTGPQRRAGALSDLARLTLDHGLAGASAAVRPHLNVLVDYPTLLTLTAAADAADPLDATGSGRLDPHPADTHHGPPDPATIDPATITPALFEDGQPVPRAVLDKLMCDAEVTRIVFGPDSQLLNVGRARRTYTGQLRRAVIARDKHCQYPTCHAPPRLCEGHHTRHWYRDHADTDARSGILLCWHHHGYVHDNGIEIHWKTGHGWQFTNRHGAPLHPD